MKNKIIYIHETENIYSCNGEIHLVYNNNIIVLNAINLLNDLDIIVHLTFKEIEKQKKLTKQNIKQTLKNI